MNPALPNSQVVLISGAGRAPGPLLAETLAQTGASVASMDLSPVLLDPVARRVQAAGGTIRTYVGDVSRGMPARALMDEVLTDWERVDVLINNPRIAPDSSLVTMDEWDWQHTLELNLSGPFLLTQFAARLMMEQGGGVILNILAESSLAQRAPGRTAYAVTQAGLLAFSQSAARELMAYNIRVFALCLDDAALQNLPNDDNSVTGSRANSLSELVQFLCSPAAQHLPGQVFHIDSNQQAQPRQE